MVNESRPTAITPAQATQGWERFRDDAREAVLTRIVAARGQDGEARPAGLVRATVLQRLNAVEAWVDIAGKAFHIQSRQTLTPGNSVMLRIVDEHSFQQSGADLRFSSSGTSAASLSSAAPATATRGVSPSPMPAPAALQTSNADASVTLSGAARLLLALQNERPIDARRALVLNLAMQAGHSPLQAAQRLQQAVSQSGLFYESHLLEWTQGRRPVASLQPEPQAALSPGLRTPAPDTDVPEVAPTLPANPEHAATRGLQAALDAIPASLRPWVHEQIALLVTGSMQVQIDWSGLPVELDIRPDDSADANADLTMSWKTTLTVHAPHLGTLVLNLDLNGTQTRLHIQPDTRQTRGQALRDLQQQLQQAGLALHEALSSQGLQLTDFQVPISPRRPGGGP